MKSFLKILAYMSIGTFVFFIFIILMFSYAIRPFKMIYKSEIVSIGLVEVRQIDYLYPEDLKRFNDSVHPLVLNLSLQINDSMLSNSRASLGIQIIPSATAAVDPGRISVFMFSDSIAGLKVLSVSKTDTIEVTSDFKLSLTSQPIDRILCSSESVGDWMMIRVAQNDMFRTSYQLYRFKNSLEKANNIVVKMIFKSGKVLDASYII